MDRKEFIKNEIKQDPMDPFNHYLLAIELIKERAIKEALEQFELIISDFQTTWRPIIRMPMCFWKMIRTRGQKKSFRKEF